MTRKRDLGRDVHTSMNVTAHDVRAAVRALGLTGSAVCLHSSLRSFGHVDGGPGSVVGAFLAQGCSLLVPTFSWDAYRLDGVPGLMPDRNGWDAEASELPPATGRVFSPVSNEIDAASMGAIPTWMLAQRGRARSTHPLCSFTALGPGAAELTREQSPTNVFGPLKALARAEGFVVLAGVGLERMTMLHLAEELAGRRMFVRWACDPDGRPSIFESGGCSAGFPRLDALLAPLERTVDVGLSRWCVYPAREILELASPAIRAEPSITHCGTPGCRCDDAVAGGPVWPRLRPHTVQLQSGSVGLRPMTEDDWPYLERWNVDPEILWFSEGDDVTSRTPQEVRGMFRDVSQNALCFMIEVDGEVIGECWLQRMNIERLLGAHPGRDVRRIDITIGRKDLWGRGYGTRAARLLVELAFGEGADVVYGLVGGHNPRSRAMFLRAGFREGRRVPEPDGVKAAFSYDLAALRPAGLL